jgi:two-component system cell cycle response regulator DivK
MGTPDVTSVLVVNSFDSRDMYAEYLRLHDYTVRAAATPEEALDEIAAFLPDVVVCDFVFQRSRFDGPAFIRLLRARPEFDNTSVIVVSGYVRAEDRRQSREAGADLFLVSPCLPDHLLFEIRRVLASRREGRPLTWNWPAPSAVADRPQVERRRGPADRSERTDIVIEPMGGIASTDPEAT